jgi:signal transduction histidine kinase
MSTTAIETLAKLRAAASARLHSNRTTAKAHFQQARASVWAHVSEAEGLQVPPSRGSRETSCASTSRGRHSEESQNMNACLFLAANLAHELNNVLGPIIGYCELAQDHAVQSSPLSRYLNNIMIAARRAQSLADHVLVLSRAERANRVPVRLQSVVAEVLELLQGTIAAGIEVRGELAAPSARVAGDELRLHQVTMNLCMNAVHAMPRGGVLGVQLEQRRLLAPQAFTRGHLTAGLYACLTVHDSGTGIASNVIDRVFEPFFTTKAAGTGTGLGLALVDQVVSGLGGAIQVASELGVGTRIDVWLPVATET